MSLREPTLVEALNNHFEYSMSNTYTAIPGVVVSVKNMGQMTVDVQPSVNVRSADGLDVAERPPILNVPFHMPVTKEGGLTYPISAGTPVFLIFSMRGMDSWKRGNGYPTTPTDNRMFDIRDCVAVPGLYPGGQSPNDPGKRTNSHSPDDVVLVHGIGTGSECEIRLKADGSVIVNTNNKVTINTNEAEINASNTVVNSPTLFNGPVTMTQGMTLGGGTGATMSIVGNIEHTGDFASEGGAMTHDDVNVGSTHVHSGIQPGGADTEVPH